MAAGLGVEPSHNGFRDRRATITLARNISYSSVRNVKRLSALPTKLKKLTNKEFVVGIVGFEPTLEGF